MILAAGAGARLGGVAKALLRRGGERFLGRIARLAGEVGVAAPIVVVGPPHGDAVAAASRALGLVVIENPDPARGMASSIALGFAALPEGALDAAWLWPVDHPDVEIATLVRLRDALGAHEVALPRWAGRGGHPPLITRGLWSRLADCAGLPAGARSVLATADVIAVEVDDPGVVRDVDTPADLGADLVEVS